MKPAEKDLYDLAITIYVHQSCTPFEAIAHAGKFLRAWDSTGKGPPLPQSSYEFAEAFNARKAAKSRRGGSAA